MPVQRLLFSSTFEIVIEKRWNDPILQNKLKIAIWSFLLLDTLQFHMYYDKVLYFCIFSGKVFAICHFEMYIFKEMVMVKAIDDVHFLALKKFISFNEKPFSKLCIIRKTNCIRKNCKKAEHVFNKNLVLCATVNISGYYHQWQKISVVRDTLIL